MPLLHGGDEMGGKHLEAVLHHSPRSIPSKGDFPSSSLFMCFINTGKPGSGPRGDTFSQSSWADQAIFGLNANLLISAKPTAFEKLKSITQEQVLLSTVSVRLKIYLTRDSLRQPMVRHSQPFAHN